MNGLMESFVFDLQLFAAGEPSYDPWGTFYADGSDGYEEKSPEEIKSSDTDADDLVEGDVIWTEEANTIATGDVKKVVYDTSKTYTQEVTQSDGTVVTITVIPTAAVAGAEIDMSSGSATANLGTGANATKFDVTEGSNVTVNYGQDADGNYTGEPASVSTGTGNTTIAIGGTTSGVGIGITDSSNGARIGLRNGRPSVLSFLGNLAFTLYRALTSADANYTPDTTSAGATVTFADFNENVDNNYVNLSDNGKEVVEINMANRTDATVTVTGTYDYTLTVHESDANETQVSSEDFELNNVTDTSAYTFTVLENDGLKLDLTAVAANNTSKPVSLAEAGGVDVVLPPTATNGSIKIDGTTYNYTTQTGSEGGFLLDSNGAATAFFLGATGDSFRVAAGSDFSVYDGDDTSTDLTDEVTATGGDIILTKTATDYKVGYVFTAVGDTITLTEDQAENFEMFYKNKKVEYDIVEPTEVDGSYTVTMTAKDTFVISNLDADADVVVSGAELTFENAGGSVTMAATTNASTGLATLAINGIAATSGTVEFDDDAAALLANGFTFNGETVTRADMDAFTYNASTSTIEVNANTVYGVGSKTFTFNGKTYTVADDKDGIVQFTLDDNGNVTAISDLNGGTVTGDLAGLTVNGTTVNATATTLTVTGTEDGTGIEGLTFDNNGGEAPLTPTATAGTYTGVYNGQTVTVVDANGRADRDITVIVDQNGKITVKGIIDNDTVTMPTDATLELATDSSDGDATDIVTINGIIYTVLNDNGNLTLTGNGKIDGLDEAAAVKVNYNGNTPIDITVNDQIYPANEVNSMLAKEAIIGYRTKAGTDSSYMQDATQPIISNGTPLIDDDFVDIMNDVLKVNSLADSIVSESSNFATHPSLTSYDFTTDDRSDMRMLVYLDKSGDTDVIFNDTGKNVAVVGKDPAATYTDAELSAGIGVIRNSTKNITLGNRDDIVVVRGDAADKYSHVNITGGTGDDTVVVQGSMTRDTTESTSVPVTFDMSKGGADKLITYASANARITLNGYSDTTGAGIVIHEPEALNIASAIEGDLLMFDNGTVVTIDRDETARGFNRKTEIVVNNTNPEHQTLVRLFTPRDTGDSYKDDAGQLVGFTGKDGGTLNASDKTEDLILVGNKSGKNAGSSLVAGSGDDLIYAGKGDTVNAGEGANVINLTGGAGAEIVLGTGNTTINSLTTGFDGDVLRIEAVDDVSFDGSNIIVKGVDNSATASVTAGNYVNQLFAVGDETVKAVIAADGQDISVTGSDVPQYFLGNAGVDFSSYSGEVVVDATGKWKDTKVGGESAYFSSNITSLKGGSGITQFYGAEGDDYFVAGTGATSLYGGAGNNTLVGNASDTAPTEFFVLGNKDGATNTIQNFQTNGDIINTDFASNYISKVTVDSTGSDVILSVTSRNDSVTTEYAVIEDAVDKGDILIGTANNIVAVGQIGTAEATVDGVANYIAATANVPATLNVSSDVIGKMGVWLDNRGDKWFSDNFAVIDASSAVAALELAGDIKSNTIYGGLGSNSLWGGAGNAGDLLVGGLGQNDFFYEQGNGNDTVNSASDGDFVNLFDTSLENIISSNISSTGVVLNFSNGQSLTVNSNAAVNYKLADGSIYNADHNTGTWNKKS